MASRGSRHRRCEQIEISESANPDIEAKLILRRLSLTITDTALLDITPCTRMVRGTGNIIQPIVVDEVDPSFNLREI